ncbi:MAG TPA: AMP-binding protein, partial [Thermoanaerobaculia bacterium]
LLATKELLSGAIRNQQYPFSRLLIDLPDERRPRQLPLIAAMAGFHEEIPDTPYDLAVRFEAAADRVQAAFRFDARLYDEATIRDFAELFEGVLRQGLANPSVRIANPPPEPFREAGDVQPPPTAGVRLHELIESQAARNPESLAVIDRGRETTSGALQRAAEGLAETLAGLALDTRRPIVILMDAGTEMIVSMLAVLRIGAAFAPLKLLSTRGGPLGGILEALDSPCILCQPEHVADLQRLTAGPDGLRHIVTVDRLSFQIAVQAEAAPAGAPPAAAPLLPEGGETACVLVDGREGSRSPSLVTHAELVSLFQWLNGRCGIGPDDRCLLSPGLGASEQLYDMLGVLSAGGSVEIPDAEDLKSTALLTERLLAPAITVWDLPTPLAQNLLGELLARCAGEPRLRGPRNILLSGEKQCGSLAEELARCFPEARITGLYAGPAGGLWTTFFPLREDAGEPHGGVTARAIPGVEHQVLDRSGQPALLRSGELHLRSLLAASAPALRTGLRAKAL